MKQLQQWSQNNGAGAGNLLPSVLSVRLFNCPHLVQAENGNEVVKQLRQREVEERRAT